MSWQPRSIKDISTSLRMALAPSHDGRFVVRHGELKTPFVYLGDTIWETYHRLDMDKAKLLLQNRAAKGFNVEMAVILGGKD
ncbi:hypothetical protein I317_05033 [Kwoniella heveanensis CBS 569]|uniref:Apiosidase-like catalytic domain-containing protein n=1 Tax=Kwoniella heveanensis BCC8398 TaxID=1296120 RepID=A0A1B9GIM6_9TREE|nr:hypothetical protein I316_07512 [Kwoniella heveanensis BCC8398]OCF41119.1 hypothetical protein I317_05033 [Kwoniella heveanensis CBS 569]